MPATRENATCTLVDKGLAVFNRQCGCHPREKCVALGLFCLIAVAGNAHDYQREDDNA